MLWITYSDQNGMNKKPENIIVGKSWPLDDDLCLVAAVALLFERI